MKILIEARIPLIFGADFIFRLRLELVALSQWRVYPRSVPEACFLELVARGLFSRAWNRRHIVPTLGSGCIFSRA